MDKKYISRVELHCHTGFSKKDGTASVRDIINFAVKEGISSVAFTDHGNVMAYPEIQSYVSKHEGFKPIYGIEAYVVNDIDMLGDNLECVRSERLDRDIVVFDIETTGFSPVTNEIIEIGAVKICNGEITDRFSVFVKPSKSIPKRIAELTGINNELVEDAEAINVILPRFLEFVEGSILVAHNSSFDISFIKEAAKRLDRQFDYKSIDTWTLSRLLFHELSSYSLDNVAKACSVSLENHHRAVDDAEATAEIYMKMVQMLKADGIDTIGAVIEKIYSVGIANCCISEMSIAELYYGAVKGNKEKNFEDITKIERFFQVIDSCEGKVELVTGEGDRLNLKSKLSQYVSMAKIFSDGTIDELEIVAYEPKDIDKLISFMVNG